MLTVSQPIAGSMQTKGLQRWPNTESVVYLGAAPQQTSVIYSILLQCWPSGFDTSPTLKQHGRLSRVCLDCYTGDALLLPSPEKPPPR